jgi:SAM-dependent methyltransferase
MGSDASNMAQLQAANMSYDSAMLERHLRASYASIAASASATEAMSPSLDDLSIRFAAFTRTARSDALDIGCGDGIATAAALVRGGHVLAMDPDRDALNKLLARVPPEHYRRLKVRVGRLPDLDFKFARFSAIHAARVLHVLEPDELQQSLRKFFRWLYPAGKLFLSTLAPEGAYWEFAESEFARRKRAQDPWPGYIAPGDRVNGRRRRPGWPEDSAAVHLLDETVLRRELEAAGFALDYVSCYPLPWDADQMCCAVIAHCAA